MRPAASQWLEAWGRGELTVRLGVLGRLPFSHVMILHWNWVHDSAALEALQRNRGRSPALEAGTKPIPLARRLTRQAPWPKKLLVWWRTTAGCSSGAGRLRAMKDIDVVVVHPRRLFPAWVEWVSQPVGPRDARRVTVVESHWVGSDLLARLARAQSPHGEIEVVTPVDLVRQTLPKGGGAPPGLAESVLAPILSARLAPSSRWRTQPRAAAGLLAACRALRRRRVSVNSLRALDPELADGLSTAYEVWDRMGAALGDEVTLNERMRREPADWPASVPVAVYGLGDGWMNTYPWLVRWLQDRPATVFVPWADHDDATGRADSVPKRQSADLGWWERHGAVIREDRPGHPEWDAHPSRAVLQLTEPDDRRLAVWSLVRKLTAEDECLVVVDDAVDAAALARDLSALGIEARCALAQARPPRRSAAGAAWDASVERPPASALMEWVRGRLTVEDECQLYAVLDYPDRWPDTVRRRHADLVRARAEVLSSSRWVEAEQRLERWALSAQVPLPPCGYDVVQWDMGDVTVTAQGLEAWLAVRINTEAQREAQEGAAPPQVWVVDLAGSVGATPSVLIWAASGTFSESHGLAGEAPAVARILTAPVRQALGLADDLEATASRQRRLLESSSHRVWMVGTQALLETPEAEVLTFEPPQRQGGGLSTALLRNLDGFGAFDGRFAAHTIPAPHSASGFEQFGRCPLQYAWRALDVTPGLVSSQEPDPRLTGLWMHRVLARAAGALPVPTLADVQRMLADEVAASPPADSVLPSVLEGRLAQLAADLHHVLVSAPPAGRVYAEQAWHLAWEGYELRGVMDRVEELPDGSWLVVDYKSGTVDAARVDPQHLQLALYARAVADQFGVPLNRVRAQYWGIHSHNAFRQRELAPPMVERWEEARSIMDEIRARIAAGQLFMFPQGEACRSCDWRAACPADAAARGRRKVAAEEKFRSLWQASPHPDGQEEGARDVSD